MDWCRATGLVIGGTPLIGDVRQYLSSRPVPGSLLRNYRGEAAADTQTFQLDTITIWWLAPTGWEHPHTSKTETLRQFFLTSWDSIIIFLSLCMSTDRKELIDILVQFLSYLTLVTLIVTVLLTSFIEHPVPLILLQLNFDQMSSLYYIILRLSLLRSQPSLVMTSGRWLKIK